jgi:hypothetical protein
MKRDRNKLYCFSPLVMITTFAIEISLAIYVLWRYHLNEVTRVTFTLLVMLATFQLAEYMVCEGPLGGSAVWSRLGFAAITLLPPLGIHLVYALAQAKRRTLLLPAYGLAAAFALFFLSVSTAFAGHVCAGNYVIFDVTPGLGGLFAVYYYGGLLAAVLLARHYGLRSPSARLRRSLTALSIGYAGFIVPTATVNIINPDTIRAIPSIMCGFAVILAVVLVVAVLPGMVKTRRQRG